MLDIGVFKQALSNRSIELDGSQHAETEIINKDKTKQEYAEKLGYKVLRFNNNDIQNNVEGVLESLRLSIG